MDHGMTRVFATLFDKDTEMIQLGIESFGMVRRGSLLHLNDSTTHPIPSQMTIGCYRILTVRHLSQYARTFITLNFYNRVVAQKPT